MINELRHLIQQSGSQLIAQAHVDLDATHRALHAYLAVLQREILPPYDIYLKKQCEGEEDPEESIQGQRKEIQKGFRAIGPLLMEGKWGVLQQIFKRHFCDDCFVPFEELKQYHDIIALQGLLGETLPFKNLCKEEALEEFVDKIAKEQVPISILHNALKAIVGSTLSSLEHALQELWEQRGESGSWALFDTPDPETVAANQLLKPGSIVQALDPPDLLHTFTLGEELGPKEGHHRFFCVNSYATSIVTLTSQLIKSSDKMVLWFPPNPILASLMKKRASDQSIEKRSHCLPLNEPTFVDPNGRFCIVEKLHTQVGGETWAQQLDRYLPPVIAWLNWLRETDISPSNFKPEYILFNEEQRMTSVKEMLPLPYNQEAMLAFAKKISRGNAGIYRQIVEGAKLH